MSRALQSLVLLLGLAVAMLARAQPIPASPPADYRAENGVLTVTLEAKAQQIDLGPVTIDGLVYNGHFTGPTLHVYPGDLLRITLVNRLDKVTNLHFHGMETSPLGNSDNVHIQVSPGKSFLYEVRIPKAQPPGLYWYHAHIHHLSEEQVMHGLVGPLMVEGFSAQFPELAGISEKILALQEVTFDDSPDPVIGKQFHDRIQTVNGQLNTVLTMRPGETQLWHVSNNSANLYFELALPGHKFRILGEDGSTGSVETVVDYLRIKPAGRFAILVDAGEAGHFSLLSRKVPIGSGANRVLDRPLAEVVVAGDPVEPRPTLTRFPSGVDLSAVTPDATRTVVFSESKDALSYFVDGRKFDMERVDARVPLGNVEKWTIRNDSDDLHVFHIHQLHFQVIGVNDQPKPFDGYVDTVQVPERGSVTLVIPFTHPEIVGRFMYHCHILAHEDKGMMAQIEVYDPNAPADGTLWDRLTRFLLGQAEPIWGKICRTTG